MVFHCYDERGLPTPATSFLEDPVVRLSKTTETWKCVKEGPTRCLCITWKGFVIVVKLCICFPVNFFSWLTISSRIFVYRAVCLDIDLNRPCVRSKLVSYNPQLKYEQTSGRELPCSNYTKRKQQRTGNFQKSPTPFALNLLPIL